MSVTKKGGKYYIRGKIKRDDGSYYNYYRLVKDAKKMGDARLYEANFLRGYQDTDEIYKQISFRQLSEIYLSKDKAVKESTLISKKEILKIINNEIGNKQINLIKSSVLQKFIDRLEQTYSVEYVKKIYYTMNPIFEFAVINNYINKNPLKAVVRNIKKDAIQQEKEYITPEQFDAFITAATEEPYRTLFMFLYYMGCRRGEALALRWTDIDFERNIVRINKTMSYKVNPPAATSPKTKNSIRNISMPKILFDAMINYKNTQEHIYAFSEEMYVFGCDKPLSPETLRQKLKKCIIAANLLLEEEGKCESSIKVPNFHIHSFRHSHASYLINNKSDKFTDFDIAKRLGDTVQTLHSTYAHWFNDAEKSIMDFMNTDIK